MSFHFQENQLVLGHHIERLSVNNLLLQPVLFLANEHDNYIIDIISYGWEVS